FALAFKRQAEVVQDGLQQAGAIAAMAMSQKAASGLIAEAIEKAMSQERLASAGFPGQQGESLIVLNRRQKLGERAFVAVCGIIALPIGSGPNRPVPQAEMRLIHRASVPRPARTRASPYRSQSENGVGNLRGSQACAE